MDDIVTTEKLHARQEFHILGKPIGPICNLDCQYCFYLKKEALFPETQSYRMKKETQERFIQQYIEAQPEGTKQINISWQGGEPTLLGVDFFKQAIEFQEKYKRPGMEIHNSIQTNGILLNDQWGEFLAKHRFLVGISIDGPAHLHDRYRIDKKGQPTHQKVLKGLEALKNHRVEFNTLSCVQKYNSYHGKEVYDYLKSIGSKFFQFIPIVEKTPEGAIADYSVESKQYGRFLNKLFDRWLKSKDVGEIFIRDFDNLLAQVMGYPATVCVTAETCGRAMAIEHNGNLYSCDHFVNPENYLGNIIENPLAEMVDGPLQTQFGQDKKDKLPRYCRECKFLSVCHGGCPKDRLIQTPDGEPGLNYLCEGYKLFFAHTIPVFEKMAECLRQRRPASDYNKL